VPTSLARKIAAAKKEAAKARAGREFLSPQPPFLPAPPERSVLVLPREARQLVRILFKMGSDFFQQTPPIATHYLIKFSTGTFFQVVV